MPEQQVVDKSLTAAEIICLIGREFEKSPTEKTMGALLRRYSTGNAKTDKVVRGFAEDTLLLMERQVSERKSSRKK